MILDLLVSKEAFCNEKKICELSNQIQFFFQVRQPSGRFDNACRPAGGRPVDQKTLISQLREDGFLPEPSKHQVSVILTSLPIGKTSARSFSNDDRNVGIISNYLENKMGDADTVWFAMNILHMGMARLLNKPCQDDLCICGLSHAFAYLCSGCEDFLKNLGFKDAIRHLKSSINWVNEQSRKATPSLKLPQNQLRKSELTLASHYAKEASEKGLKPLQDKIILMVLHFLSDLIPLCYALVEFGAKPENLIFIAKPYPYAQRDRITHELEIIGAQVWRSSKAQDVENVARDVLRDLLRNTELKERVVVIEDGGYFAPLLHEPQFSTILEHCVGVVEQTTKGIRQDEKIKDPKIPILSVAKSKFKDTYEAPEIGRISVQNITRFVPNVKLSGCRAVVFGFGAIGKEVAFNLNKTFNMGIGIVDTDHLRVLEAKHHKDYVSEAEYRFDELMFRKPILVVGTTGGPSITKEVLAQLPDGCILVSTSSDQVEIAVECLASAREIETIEEGKTEYTIEEDGQIRKLTLLAEGYPINFYGSESLPNDTIDPVLTLLLLCAVHLCEQNLSPGVSENIVNKITEEKKLVEEFLSHTPR
jgi:S-adenosylhomocysteine hydrolase